MVLLAAVTARSGRHRRIWRPLRPYLRGTSPQSAPPVQIRPGTGTGAGWSGHWHRRATGQRCRVCNPLGGRPAATQVHCSRGSSRNPRLGLRGAHMLLRARSPAARWSLPSSSCRRAYKIALLTKSGSMYLETGLTKRLRAPASCKFWMPSPQRWPAAASLAERVVCRSCNYVIEFNIKLLVGPLCARGPLLRVRFLHRLHTSCRARRVGLTF